MSNEPFMPPLPHVDPPSQETIERLHLLSKIDIITVQTAPTVEYEKGGNAMSPKAKELLIKLVASFDSNHKNDFDSLFYYEFSDGVINELDYLGYIVKQNDIVGTIKLTRAGYEAAKQ